MTMGTGEVGGSKKAMGRMLGWVGEDEKVMASQCYLR